MTTIYTVTGSARFRSGRLLLDDLREIETALAGDAVLWRSRKSESESIPNAVSEESQTAYQKVISYETDTLDELVKVAPKGRLFHFEVESKRDGRRLRLKVGTPRGRWLTLDCEDEGDSIPRIFQDIAVVLKKAENRGRRWHYAGIVFGPTLAIYLPVIIFDQLSSLGLFSEESGPPHNLAGAAATTFLAFIFLVPLSSGIWSWMTSSSVTLKPRFDTASFSAKLLQGTVRLLKWLGSLYRKDELADHKMLIATVTAAFFGIGSFIVAILAWLFPMK